MESRKSPPDLKILELVTADNIHARMADVEIALNLRKDALLPILRADNELTLLHDDLQKNAQERIDHLDNLIINAAATQEDDERIADFMETNRQQLKTMLEPIYFDLQAKKEALVNAHRAELAKALDTLIKDENFKAGNYAIALRILKINIAITLQNAAQYLYSNQVDLRENPKAFNTIFHGISTIDKEGAIQHNASCLESYANVELHEAQQMLTGLLDRCNTQKETAILAAVKRYLLSLNHTSNNEIINDHPVLTIDNEHLQFNQELYDIEQKTHHATTETKRMLIDLERGFDAKVDDFENDPSLTAPMKTLTDAIFKAESDINHFKATIVHENTANRVARSPTTPASLAVVAPPEPVAPAELASPNLKFWQKPLFKKVMIGAAIGFGVTLLAAGIVAAIFFSGGAAGLAIGAAATAIVAKIGIGGAIGCLVGATVTATGIGASIGAIIDHNTKSSPPAAAPALERSSSARVISEVREPGNTASVAAAPVEVAAPTTPAQSTTSTPLLSEDLQPTADLPRLK